MTPKIGMNSHLSWLTSTKTLMLLYVLQPHSSDDGGLYSSTPQYWTPRTTPVRKKDGMEYIIHIRHQMAERHFSPSLDPTRKSKEFPLLTRAWTYQERLLSPRLVYFTAGEIMWECSKVSACECFEPGTNARPDCLDP